MEKTRCPLRLVVIFRNYFFVWLNITAESVNCSLFVIDYRYRPGLFEVIDYRYRFSTERFIVPITVYTIIAHFFKYIAV